MLIHVLHFKFEFLESMENALNKMIQKLLDRKIKMQSKKHLDFQKDLLTELEVSKHTPIGFETQLFGNDISKHTPISFETQLSGNDVLKHRMKISKYTSKT